MALEAEPQGAPPPSALPDWLSPELDAVAAECGLLRAPEPEAEWQIAPAEPAAPEELPPAESRPQRRVSLPLWLKPEMDATAAESGLLRPEGLREAPPTSAVAARAGSERAAPAPPPPSSTRSAAASRAGTSGSASSRSAPAPTPDAEAAAARHSAVHAALQGEVPEWHRRIPAQALQAPPYPLWLAPELDGLRRLHPGALPHGAPAPKVPAPAPPRERVFALQPANPGDEIVVMTRTEGSRTAFGAGGARAGAAVLLNVFGADGWPGGEPPKPAPAPAKPKPVAVKTEDDTWHYSWEVVAAQEEVVDGGPPELPHAGASGPTLASRIAAVVVSHEPDARAYWRD